MKFSRYNKEIEFILNEIKNGNREEIPKDIYMNYFRFRYNFFKYSGVSELSNLYEYPQQVIEYIEQLYPFCFMDHDGLTEFPEMLTKYIYLLGGKEIDVEAICEILKNTKIKNIDRHFYYENYESAFVQKNINITDVLGTSVIAYQGSNLYDVLERIDDKRIDNYMWYLCINNVFNNKEKYDDVFDGVAFIVDENNNLYISEGNHRIFSYLALLKIREYLGLKNECINFQIEKNVLKFKTKIDVMTSKYK